jgi:acetyltransferase-like isoleucine patch superfamily enzyme
MTGRERFARFAPLIGKLSSLLRCIPRAFFEKTWFLPQGWPGVPGILVRYLYARRLSRFVGSNVMIGPNCTILGWRDLEIGNNVTIHVGCYLDAKGGITIGSDVSIAHYSSILSFDHTWADTTVPIKYNPLSFASVTIEDDVWIGCGVRILSGATVLQRTVVAAGAVVTKGVTGPGVVAGVPGKLKHSFDVRH